MSTDRPSFADSWNISDVIFQIQLRIFSVAKHTNCQVTYACLLQPCSHVVLVGHAAICVQAPDPSFPPACAVWCIPERLDFLWYSLQEGGQLTSHPSKHRSKLAVLEMRIQHQLQHVRTVKKLPCCPSPSCPCLQCMRKLFCVTAQNSSFLLL